MDMNDTLRTAAPFFLKRSANEKTKTNLELWTSTEPATSISNLAAILPKPVMVHLLSLNGPTDDPAAGVANKGARAGQKKTLNSYSNRQQLQVEHSRPQQTATHR